MPRMRDRGRGRSTQAASSSPTDPQDVSYYNYESIWQEGFEDISWYAEANVDSAQPIPFTIYNDAPNGDDGNVADGNDVIVWTIEDNSSYGFANDTYIFSEDASQNANGSLEQSIPLVANSSIKAVTIIILDNEQPSSTLPGADDNDNDLTGSTANDVILAYAGNDSVEGADGRDDLFGGAGNDTLKGENGDDYAQGGNGNDQLYGGAGDDILDGLSGNDNLFGGADNDKLWGGEGNDSLEGNDGDDTLIGEAGIDTLSGGEGNDSLVGGLGNDSLSGGDGNDRLNGYGTTVTNDTQYDTLVGGAGADYFILGGTWGASYVETGPGYAIITDFDWQQGDKFEVYGVSSDYSLDYSENITGSSAVDTAIYYNDDLIAVVQDNTNVLLPDDFIFV